MRCLVCLGGRGGWISGGGEYTAKNAQVATSVLTSCNETLVARLFVIRLAQVRYLHACVRMARDRLVDNESVASCQQSFCKLIVKTCYAQAYKM